MSAITTHILDTSLGRPAEGVSIVLEIQKGDDNWEEIGCGVTDNDGRLRTLISSAASLQTGVYRISFDVADYFSQQQRESFYTVISIVFVVRDNSEHYHIPLLLNPFGYSTYRGS